MGWHGIIRFQDRLISIKSHQRKHNWQIYISMYYLKNVVINHVSLWAGFGQGVVRVRPPQRARTVHYRIVLFGSFYLRLAGMHIVELCSKFKLRREEVLYSFDNWHVMEIYIGTVIIWFRRKYINVVCINTTLIYSYFKYLWPRLIVVE